MSNKKMEGHIILPFLLCISRDTHPFCGMNYTIKAATSAKIA